MNRKKTQEEERNLALERAIKALKGAYFKLEKYENQSKEPIAIIGMSCRVPGGSYTPEAFWEFLQNGVDAITEVPPDRWPVDQYYDSDPTAPGKISTRYGGFVDGLQEFDASFFGISPKEAIYLDPQHRLLLEVSWEALERSGIAPQELTGTSTGVFVGICSNDYAQKILSQGLEQIDAYLGLGNSHSTASGRISYLLGLKGPSLAVDTACSSSLVSIHLACSSLKNRECDLALSGGVSALIFPGVSINLSKGGMLSPDGRCKTFDASADGFVRSEGCGMVVLKRLSDAVANGDNILAVIRGTAINQDGDSSGLTVPNGPSQQAVIRQAMKNGGVDPGSISYLETHGTGTSLGDPIEVGAIGTVFRKTHSQEQPLIIGAVKTNIGHLEGAAGIVGLIKVVLQLENQKIAPSLHFHQPNPYINWDELPVKVATKLTSWETNGKSRIAGVSSFGFSGTNAHVVIEEATGQVKSQKSKVKKRDDLERSLHLLTLSAKTEKALADLVNSYQSYLEAESNDSELRDICYTANTGRTHFNHRLAVVAPNRQELLEKLRQHNQKEEVTGVYSGKLINNTTTSPIVFLFTGQGSQYVNMGRQLYQQALTFREVIHQCAEILSNVETFKERSLLEILYPPEGDKSDSFLLDQTAYTQPALFVVEYGLAKLWESWGIKPDVVMGHSVGEYVAATVAGVFSLEDGLKLIAMRGQLMQKLPSGGEMVSVMTSESVVKEAIGEYSSQVTIAAINGPESIVISGESEAIASISSFLESQGVKTNQLQVSHAFHSPLMAPMLTEFEAVANQITYNQPQIPLISNVTGEKVRGEIRTAEYWTRHVREPVKFAQSMKTLGEEGYEIFLEIGPKPILLSMGRQCVPESEGEWLPSLRPGVDEWQQMLSSLGQLYVRGAKIDWLRFDSDYTRQKVVLPTYPFQRQRYWVEITENKQKEYQKLENISETPIVKLLTQGRTEALTQKLERAINFSPEKLKLLPEILDALAEQCQEQLAAVNIKNWFYEVQWKPLAQTHSKTSIQSSHWLIFADTTGVAEKLGQKLQQQGHKYSLVYRAQSYQKQAAGKYQLNPNIPEEFEKLYQEVKESTQITLSKLIHLWSLDAPESQDLTLNTLEETQLWGCGSVMHLLQTLLKNASIPQLWLVTRGSQSVLSKTENNNITGLAAAPLWGLGRVVSLEHPQLWGGLVDLDPQALEGDEVEMLWQLLVNEQEEDNLALRGENTYVARLANQSPPEFPKPLSLSSDGSYLITGGLGSLGLHMAEWLVEKGAKNIVLTGRRPPSEKVKESIQKLEQSGCKVNVLLGDIAIEEEIAKILEQIQTSLPTLKGIIHAAGVLDDGTIQQMNWERFTKVMSPKVIGTWQLHKLTQNLPLDFFVCFSSMASLIGSPGQGNYAAANAFMDALARYRRSRGLSGLSINWGVWASGGMAARLALKHQNRIQTSGISEIAPKEGMYALDLLLGNQFATEQVGVIAVDWPIFAEHWSGIKKSSLLRELLQKEELEEQDTLKQKVKAEILAKLETASLEERKEILTEHIRGQVAQVLGLSSSQLPEMNLGFMEMGMDSLMTVELKNRLQNQLGINLPETIAMEYPTIAKLSLYVIEELMEWKTTENATFSDDLSKNDVSEDSKILPVLEDISEEDFAALAAQQLEKIKNML